MGVVFRWLSQGQGVGTVAKPSNVSLSPTGKAALPQNPLYKFKETVPRSAAQMPLVARPKTANPWKDATLSTTRAAGTANIENVERVKTETRKIPEQYPNPSDNFVGLKGKHPRKWTVGSI